MVGVVLVANVEDIFLAYSILLILEKLSFEGTNYAIK